MMEAVVVLEMLLVVETEPLLRQRIGEGNIRSLGEVVYYERGTLVHVILQEDWSVWH